MHECLQLRRDAECDRFRAVAAKIQSYGGMEPPQQVLSHVGSNHLEQIITTSFRAEQSDKCNASPREYLQRFSIQLEVVMHDEGCVNQSVFDRLDR